MNEAQQRVAEQIKKLADPGKGNRTPNAWGKWLTDKLGLQRQILGAMQDKPIYLGTADPRAVAKRRAKNKVSRKSRRINRQHRS